MNTDGLKCFVVDADIRGMERNDPHWGFLIVLHIIFHCLHQKGLVDRSEIIECLKAIEKDRDAFGPAFEIVSHVRQSLEASDRSPPSKLPALSVILGGLSDDDKNNTDNS